MAVLHLFLTSALYSVDSTLAGYNQTTWIDKVEIIWYPLSVIEHCCEHCCSTTYKPIRKNAMHPPAKCLAYSTKETLGVTLAYLSMFHDQISLHSELQCLLHKLVQLVLF